MKLEACHEVAAEVPRWVRAVRAAGVLTARQGELLDNILVLCADVDHELGTLDETAAQREEGFRSAVLDRLEKLDEKVDFLMDRAKNWRDPGTVPLGPSGGYAMMDAADANQLRLIP